GLKVIGHFEKLWESRCKKASGDRLWCGTCHDPHSVPSRQYRTKFFRQKCASCHDHCKASAEVRERSQKGCIVCHMPRLPAASAEHAAFTEHSIPRRVEAMLDRKEGAARSLVSFWAEQVDKRELGLAYSKIAKQTQDAEHFSRALELLDSVASEKTGD